MPALVIALAQAATAVPPAPAPVPELVQQIDASTGFTLIRFDVTAAGKAANCTIEKSSGVAALDTRACGIVLDKARFTPSRGPDGKPVTATRTVRITWRIEG